jgi:hypothetical protein
MVRLVALGVVLLVVASGLGPGVSTAAESPTVNDATIDSAAQHAPTSAAADSAANRSDDRQFDFRIQRVSDCGFTCRDVTITATNTGDATAENVTVQTQLATGERAVWRGSESVAELGPGESTTVTKRVTVGYFDALAVLGNGGDVTANTTVTWDSGSETFTERRKVA